MARKPKRNEALRQTARAERTGNLRGTFNVSRALDDATAALGNVVFQDRQRLARVAERRERVEQPARREQVAAPARKREQPARPEAPRRELTLESAKVDRCKPKPTAQESKGGNGGSRPFVPWCR